MSQKQYSTRLPEDKADELERYCEERNISKAEALRRSVQELTEQETDSSRSERYWRLAMGAGILFIVLAQSGVLTGGYVILSAVFVLALLLVWFTGLTE